MKYLYAIAIMMIAGCSRPSQSELDANKKLGELERRIEQLEDYNERLSMYLKRSATSVSPKQRFNSLYNSRLTETVKGRREPNGTVPRAKQRTDSPE